MNMLSVSENILLFVSGFGIVQGILLAALIYFHPKSDRSVNIFLALFISTSCIIMSTPFFLKLIDWQNTFFLFPLPYLSGPLIYLYVRSFKERITFRKAFPHFL